MKQRAWDWYRGQNQFVRSFIGVSLALYREMLGFFWSTATRSISFSLALAVVCQACEDASIAFAWLLMISSTDGKSEEIVSHVIAKKRNAEASHLSLPLYTRHTLDVQKHKKKVGKSGNQYQVRSIALSCSLSVLGNITCFDIFNKDRFSKNRIFLYNVDFYYNCHLQSSH